MSRLCVVVMGVSGAGKSTFGAAFAEDRVLPFVDADTLHSPADVTKMRSGAPLTDADRAPWLEAVGAVLADAAARPHGVVIACSALKRAYRDRLRRAAPDVGFIFLQAEACVLARRLASRPGHFMPAALLRSQLATLEPPTGAETDVLTLTAGLPLSDLRQAATGWRVRAS